VSGKSNTSEIHLKGSEDSPVLNPAFYIKNWNANGAKVLVNGKDYVNYRAGINRELEGNDLVVFVTINEVVPVDITILPAD
jgi:ABC-type oligopeptide transport system substrate-binding subunit